MKIKTSIYGVAILFQLFTGQITCQAQTDGTLDFSFGTNGFVKSNLPDKSFGQSVAIQQDGKIVVGGVSGNKLTVFRYNYNGSPDMDFNQTGQAMAEIPGVLSTDFVTLLLQGDKILISGHDDGASYIARFLGDGTPDSNFGGEDGLIGVKKIKWSDLDTDIPKTWGNQVALMNSTIALSLIPDTAIIVAVSPGSNRLLLTKLKKGDGQIISPFGGNMNGVSVNSYSARIDIPSMITQNGSILLGGQCGNDMTVLRFTSTGVPDASFNPVDHSGQVVAQLGGASAANSLVAQNNNIIAGGAVGGSFALVRILNNGTVDGSFGPSGSNGIVKTNFTIAAEGWSVKLQHDGKIILVGISGNASTNSFAIARYSNDGILDTQFGNGTGKVTTGLIGPGSDKMNVSGALQPDGRLLVAGYTNDQFITARYYCESATSAWTDYAIILDTMPNGQPSKLIGAQPSVPSWIQRTLNHIEASAGSAISLSNNSVTITGTGLYYIQASAPAYKCKRTKIELIDRNGRLLVHGTSEQAYWVKNGDLDVTLNAVSARSWAEGFIQAPCTFTLNQWFEEFYGLAAGLGVPTKAKNPGPPVPLPPRVTEVYSQIFIERIK